jgi:hypothetical protein
MHRCAAISVEINFALITRNWHFKTYLSKAMCNYIKIIFRVGSTIQAKIEALVYFSGVKI